MRELDFQTTVRHLIAELLTGNKCGFQVLSTPSVDKDEVLVKINLLSDADAKRVAKNEKLNLQLCFPELPSMPYQTGKQQDSKDFPPVQSIAQYCPELRQGIP